MSFSTFMRGITLYCKWVDSLGVFNVVWVNFFSLRNPCWLLFLTGFSLVCCSFFACLFTPPWPVPFILFCILGVPLFAWLALGWSLLFGVHGVLLPCMNIYVMKLLVGPPLLVFKFSLCWCSWFILEIRQYLPAWLMHSGFKLLGLSSSLHGGNSVSLHDWLALTLHDWAESAWILCFALICCSILAGSSILPG
jgi:hypothetical protein